MKYSFVVAALIGLVTFEQVQSVKASDEIAINNEETADSNLIAEDDNEEGHNEQQEKSEEGTDDDEAEIQVDKDDEENEADDDEAKSDGGDDDQQDDTLVYEGDRLEMDEDMDDQDDESHEDENEQNVQLDENEKLQEGEFESLEDTEVNEDMALEMEQLNFEYRPHNVETIGLNEDDDDHEQQNEEDNEEDDQADIEDTPDDSSNVQLADDFFTPAMDGHAGLGTAVYERQIPARFASDGDDFMVSMIKNYALEGKKEDGTPNGKFTMNEAITRSAALEVLKTHKKLEGKEAEEYMKQYFDRTWAHFDVTKDGQLDVDVMPQFMRFFASDQSLELS